MQETLPVFNWSVQKLLSTEINSFNKAKIRILFMLLVLALSKVFIVMGASILKGQQDQFIRGLVALVFYSTLTLLLLNKRLSVVTITHIMLGLGIIIIVTNIFHFSKSINIVTLQFAFMIILSSFYMLNRTMGLFYTILSLVPVMVYLFLHYNEPAHINNIGLENLAKPAALTIIVLNFLSIVLAHYFYHQAFSETISEKEALNYKLYEAVTEANKHAQSKSDFLSTMSHELRTPLNAVIGMVDLLLDDAYNEEQKENLETLRFSALSLHTLINDILDFNKLESGKLQLESISVNLDELLHNICAGLRLQAKEKGLELILDVDPLLKNQPVITDPTRITQVIYNLAGNGIKFTNRGSVRVTLKMIFKDAKRVNVRFSVVDTGIGIPVNKHHVIFDTFVQASTSTTRDYGGTGLGLSIVKQLLNLMGTTIKLESEPGKGSNFYFDMEFTPGEPAPQDVEVKEQKGDLTGMKVLLAEDNSINVLVVRKLCQNWKIDLTVARNGSEVLEKVNTGDYDLVLMDIHMPEMDGYDATQAIRKIKDPVKSSIPVVALTASVSHDAGEKIRAAGMNYYVHKPFNTRELYSVMKGIRNGKR
jgi:signal transduction histidine kinase/CheY-like chemotaxis protein